VIFSLLKIKCGSKLWDFSDNLVALAKDTDLLICESALPDELKVKGHLTPSLAGEIATHANVGKLVLTHW